MLFKSVKIVILFIYLTGIQIHGHSQLFFTQKPNSEYLFDQGQLTIILNCTAKSLISQIEQISWVHNDTIIQDQTYDSSFKRTILPNGSLKLDIINEYSSLYSPSIRTEANHFRCLASDSFGTITSNPIKIYTNSSSKETDILKYFRQPVNKTLYQGDDLLLRCKPILNLTKLKGKIRHKWFKNGHKIIESNTITTHKDGTLKIDSVSKLDSGSYKCIARYRQFAFESREGIVNVLTEDENEQVNLRPTFTSWPEDATAAINEDVIFECQALQHTKHSYQWFRNGFPLDLDSRVQLIQGNNLRISSLKEQDSATYKCRICTVNSIQQDCQEKSATLSVLVAPYFTNPPVDVNSTVGQDVEFKCIASGVPTPAIQWFKNGEPVYASKYFQYDGGNLKIIGLIGQDEGYYQCVAYNKLGTVDATARLLVLDNKSVEESFEDSDELPLSKKATSLESFIETTTDSVIVHLSAPISLQLDESKKNSLKISWQEPSIIKQVTNVPLNKIHNSLEYKVVWRAKNSNNQQELTTSETTLFIDQLMAETAYLLQVCAILGTNKGPYSFLEAETLGEPKYPGAPVDFKADFVDFKYQQTMSPTLKFKWKRPTVNGEGVLKYRLYYEHLHYGPVSADNDNQYDDFFGTNANNDYYFEDYSAEKLQDEKEKFLDIETPSSKNDQRNSYEFLLEDLKKYSSYKFRLVALNELMLRQYDEKSLDGGAELIIETPSDVPDGPPENLKAETINTTALFIRWNRPAVEKCNGQITGYKLAIKENDKQVWNSQEASEPRSKFINNLLPNQKYSIRVTAMTVNGSGPASDWVVAETFAHEMDESKVPDQPLELVAEPTDKAIVIHWKPPKDSNTTLVRKYLLSYGVNYPSNMIEIPGNQNSFIIKNLEPFSTYILSLKAKNNAGLGKEILKDVVTKRKSALDENENLFPPLNVQAVAISPHSIEVRWTDWHLKQDEPIPDDRLYTVQYSTSEMSSDEYLHKNSSARNVIISNLRPNTLYDFSVRLVIGIRHSDWSMTSSQMTMEASPAPRDVEIKSDLNELSNVIISWKAPNYSLISGYVISFLDVKSYSRQKANPGSRIKWKHNYVTANEDQLNLQATVRKLRTNTEYYFKVQARNNHEYGGSSPTIIFKTPNSKGIGGGIVYKDKSISKSNATAPEESSEIISSSIRPSTVSFMQNSFLLLIGTVGCSLLILILIILMILCCRRNTKSQKDKSYTGSNCTKRNYPINDNTGNQSMHGHNPQQHLLINNMSINNNGNNNNNSYAPDLMPQALPSNMNNMNNFSISSTSSTLLKHHQHNMRTPSHQQMTGLQINNPNHMMLMMNPLSVSNSITTSTNMNAPPSTNNTQLSNTNTSSNDVEFYSNMTNQPAIPNDPSYTTDSCFQFNTSYNISKQCQHQQQQQQLPIYPNQIIRTSSLNDDNLSQQNDLDRDLTSASEALSAANAPFSNNNNNNNTNMNSVSMSNTNENIFMRNTTKPKQIGVPFNGLSNTASPTSFTNPMPNGPDSLFSSANNRKSFKNLPMASSNIIQSNNQSNSSPNHPLAFNFNDLSTAKQQTQKLQYNARPYMIDNQQLQSNGEYSSHSPASSCHSSSQQSQVYDRVPNNSKSLLQPLKSFGAPSSFAHYPSSQNPSIPPSSFSIPNTPAKFCENLINNNNFMLSQSPAKKHLLVSMGDQQNTNTSIARGNNNNNKHPDVLMMMGKSFENLYDKKLSASSMNYNGELITEMANLEGIMKDLNAITNQQFDC